MQLIVTLQLWTHNSLVLDASVVHHHCCSHANLINGFGFNDSKMSTLSLLKPKAKGEDGEKSWWKDAKVCTYIYLASLLNSSRVYFSWTWVSQTPLLVGLISRTFHHAVILFPKEVHQHTEPSHIFDTQTNDCVVSFLPSSIEDLHWKMNSLSPELALSRIAPELRPLLCTVVRNGRVGLDSTNCLRITDLKSG